MCVVGVERGTKKSGLFRHGKLLFADSVYLIFN